MLQTTLLQVLLGCYCVHARVLRRDDSPAPLPSSSTTDESASQVSAAIAAFTSGLTLAKFSDSEIANITAGNVTAESIKLIGFNGCRVWKGDDGFEGIPPDAASQIFSGLSQATRLMDVAAIYNGNVDFNTAGALEYLGPSALNKDRQSDFNDIFKNFATMRQNNWHPWGWQIHVRCDDPDLVCRCGDSSTIAYTVQQDHDTRKARINFCPRYFTLPVLDDLIVQNQNAPNYVKYDMVQYGNSQGRAFAHELLHIDWVSKANPPLGDDTPSYGHNDHVTDMILQNRNSQGQLQRVPAYGPMLTKYLARYPFRTGDITIKNADSLALFMVSQYVQQQLDNTYPYLPVVNAVPNQPPQAPGEPPLPRPIQPPPSIWGTVFETDQSGNITLNSTNPLSNQWVDANEKLCSTDQDQPDPSPIVLDAFAPDSAYPSDYISSLNSWRAMATNAPDPEETQPAAVWTTSAASATSAPPPPPSATPRNPVQCSSTDSINYVVSRDAAIDAVKDFCSQGDQSKEYNKGTVNHLKLLVSDSADLTKGPNLAPDCAYRFQYAIDGCADDKNPFNWKFGSAYVGADGWTYTFSAVPGQSNNCTVYPGGISDGFTIAGKYWDPAKLGDTGEGLLDNLRGCGLVSGWAWGKLDNDPNGFQWAASGELPVGTKGCIGDAVIGAGGGTADGCTGSG